jgi:stage II sporulation protein D
MKLGEKTSTHPIYGGTSFMKHLKLFLILVSFITIIAFIVPSLLVIPFSPEQTKGNQNEAKEKTPQVEDNSSESMEVAVYRSQSDMVEKLSLEDYVVGVVASEMPAEFEMEALKAQALAARTYIVTHLTDTPDESVPMGADVTDTIDYQVYKNLTDLQELWGNDYERKIERILKAVSDTQGKVISFNGQPIEASFFSTSNGYTENSEEYWTNKIPYLKSVESPWDKNSPVFKEQKVISVEEFEQNLGVKIGDNESVGTITSRTTGKRIGSIEIGGKDFSGREIRDTLGLASSDFTWYRKNDHIVITTKGNGHGVGMSQYGANGMAAEGKSYEEIVSHFYQGVKIMNTNNLLQKYAIKN